MSKFSSVLAFFGFGKADPVASALIKAFPAPVPAATSAPIAHNDNEADAGMAQALGLANDPIDILARTLWGEARGEGEAGMQAVANVVCNRAGHPLWWGRSIISVCLEPWQFSCWNENSPERAGMLRVTDADAFYRAAWAIAAKAVSASLPDTTLGSDSYYADTIASPKWALPIEFRVQIGHHRFYRTEFAPLKGAKEA